MGKTLTGPWSRGSAVIVDFYGTLVELERDTPRTWELLCSMGYESDEALEGRFSTDRFDGCETPRGAAYANWHQTLFERHAEAAGVPKQLVPQVAKAMQENDRRWTVRARSGAISFLNAIAADGLPVAICSNWDYPIEPYFKQAGLPDLPSVCSWQTGARKPHPAMFASAARLVERSRSDCIFVGDDWSCDVVGALEAGMGVIWLTPEGSSEEIANDRLRVAESLAVATELISGCPISD